MSRGEGDYPFVRGGGSPPLIPSAAIGSDAFPSRWAYSVAAHPHNRPRDVRFANVPLARATSPIGAVVRNAELDLITARPSDRSPTFL